MVVLKKVNVMNMNSIYNFSVFLLLICLVSCSKKEDQEDLLGDNTTPTSNTPNDSIDGGDSTNSNTDESSSNVVEDGVPEVFKKIYAASIIYLEGENVVIEVNGAPDHKSPYYAANHELYEAYNGTNDNYKKNPNSIGTFDFEFKIPLNPREASDKTPTPLGSIGVALNGVSFYNQYAGPNNQPLTNEINSFDQYGGHPTGQKVYHYHLEPYYLTTNQGNDALMGFLLDGFPVYGPEENGVRVTNSDLDEYHGHSHNTADYPDGIYHYHITDADPYINGSGYFGTPGTVTQ